MKKKRAENGEKRVCSTRNEDGGADGKPRLQYVMDQCHTRCRFLACKHSHCIFRGGDDVLMISLLLVAAGRLDRCTAIQFIAVGVAARI